MKMRWTINKISSKWPYL